MKNKQRKKINKEKKKSLVNLNQWRLSKVNNK
jgi:hypothetical protein